MKADVVHLGDHVPDTRDISHGPAETATDALNLDFIVLIDKVDGAIAYGECADLPAVLNQLDTHTLPDRGVGLFCLDTDLLKHDTSRLRSTLKGIRFYIEIEFAAGIVLICPTELI